MKKSGWLLLAALALPLPRAAAQLLTVNNGNSAMYIFADNPAEMEKWLVDGQNLLQQQSFWYRVGPTAAQRSIDRISPPTVALNGPVGTISDSYANSQFSLRTVYTLAGGAPGSGVSRISEQITIQNLSAAPLDFHFFQYVNFSSINGIQLGTDASRRYTVASMDIGPLTDFEENSITPGADHGEVNADESTSNSTFHRLGTAGYTLNDVGYAVQRPFGHGVSFALEWDRTIDVNGMFIVGQTLSIAPVPEPATWTLTAIGLAAFGLMGRFSGRKEVRNGASFF